MISKAFSIFTATVLLFCVVPSNKARFQTFLSEKITFVMEDFDEEIILRKFSEQSKVPIGFEAIPSDAKGKRYKRISIHIENGTGRDVLNAFVSADSRYKWEIFNGVINISPQIPEAGILDVLVRGFRPPNVNIEELGFTILELPEVRTRMEALEIESGKTIFSTGAPRKLSKFAINLPDMTVREILNEVLRQQYANYWLVERYGDHNEYIRILL